MAKITRFSKNGELGIRDRKDLGIDVLDSKGKQLCFFNEMGCVHLYYLLQQKMTEIDQSVKDKVAKQMKNWHVDEQHERFDPLGPDDDVCFPARKTILSDFSPSKQIDPNVRITEKDLCFDYVQQRVNRDKGVAKMQMMEDALFIYGLGRGK